MPSMTDNTTSAWHDVCCNGYNKLWYLKASLCWTTALGAVADLVIFGAIYSDQDANNTLLLYGFNVFGIIGPIFSLLVSIFGIVLLFLIRKNIYLNPGWLLTFDLLAGCTLAIDLAWYGNSYMSYWNHERSWTSLRLFQVPWGFSLAIAILHVVTFFICIWETHVYRRMVRERQDISAKLVNGKGGDEDDGELLVVSGDIELGDTRVSEAPGESSARVEMPDKLRVELPDGRVIELPAGSRIELPAQSPVELPAVYPSKLSFDSSEERITSRPLRALPVELECPMSSVEGWDKSYDRLPPYQDS